MRFIVNTNYCKLIWIFFFTCLNLWFNKLERLMSGLFNYLSKYFIGETIHAIT
jgi:hypothetical protein